VNEMKPFLSALRFWWGALIGDRRVFENLPPDRDRSYSVRR